jgi:hypothetical protein
LVLKKPSVKNAKIGKPHCFFGTKLLDEDPKKRDPGELWAEVVADRGEQSIHGVTEMKGKRSLFEKSSAKTFSIVPGRSDGTWSEPRRSRNFRFVTLGRDDAVSVARTRSATY